LLDDMIIVFQNIHALFKWTALEPVLPAASFHVQLARFALTKLPSKSLPPA